MRHWQKGKDTKPAGQKGVVIY